MTGQETEERAHGYYNEGYFDGGQTVSNYFHYGHSLTSDLRYGLSALHLIVETRGFRALLERDRLEISIVDLGGAKGLLASAFQKVLPGARVLNTDLSLYATQNTVPEARTFRSDIRNLPLPDESFHIVTCVDVLEHLRGDTVPKALLEIRRILKQGGFGILVPNIGEDEAWSKDKSHVTIKGREWWKERIIESGLEIAEETRLGRALMGLSNTYLFKRISFPSISPGLFIVRKS